MATGILQTLQTSDNNWDLIRFDPTFSGLPRKVVVLSPRDILSERYHKGFSPIKPAESIFCGDYYHTEDHTFRHKRRRIDSPAIPTYDRMSAQITWIQDTLQNELHYPNSHTKGFLLSAIKTIDAVTESFITHYEGSVPEYVRERLYQESEVYKYTIAIRIRDKILQLMASRDEESAIQLLLTLPRDLLHVALTINATDHLIHRAIHRKQYRLAKAIIEQAPREYLSVIDDAGSTPLLRACFENAPWPIKEALLQKMRSKDLLAQDTKYQFTVAHCLITQKHFGQVNCVLKRMPLEGYSLVDHEGNNIFYLAAYKDSKSIIAQRIALTAPIESWFITNKRGGSVFNAAPPLRIARLTLPKLKIEKIIRLLQLSPDETHFEWIVEHISRDQERAVEQYLKAITAMTPPGMPEHDLYARFKTLKNEKRWRQFAERQIQMSFELTRERQTIVFETFLNMVRGLSRIEDRTQAGRILQRPYWIEALDEDHEFAIKQKRKWDDWRQICERDGRPFHIWKRTAYPPRMLQDLRRVEYLSPEERKIYQVSFVRDITGSTSLVQNDKILDTTNKSTAFSGKGFTAFVISTDEILYTASHKPGTFHHSSFLSGGPVIAAGELRTNPAGTLIEINNKSGHYLPTRKETLALLRFLERQGVNLSYILLRNLVKNSKSRPFYSALDYLRSSGRCAPLTEETLSDYRKMHSDIERSISPTTILPS